MNRTLDPSELGSLLKPKPRKPPVKSHPKLPPQRGPLKYYDKEQRCLTSGYWAIDTEKNERYWKKTQGKCDSPTHYELQGIPTCIAHAVDKMNEMLFEFGVER